MFLSKTKDSIFLFHRVAPTLIYATQVRRIASTGRMEHDIQNYILKVVKEGQMTMFVKVNDPFC